MAWVVLALGRNLFFPGAEVGLLFGRFAHDLVLAGAAVICLARAVSVSDERRAWTLIGIGILAWTFGETYYTVVLWTADSYPIPSLADAGYLLMYVLVIAGIIDLRRARAGKVPSTLRADGLAAALAVGAVSAALVFDKVQAAAAGDFFAVATSLAYPIFDLVLVGLVVGALAGAGWRLDRTWMLLGAGILLFWLANSLYLVRTATGNYEADTWLDGGWWGGMVLVGAAAWQSRPREPVEAPRQGARLSLMPLLFAAIGLGLLVIGTVTDVHLLAVVLAAATLVAVMGRLQLMFGENARMLHASRDEALTDHLTGLPNRRALTRRLERDLPDASDDRPLVLALFDLDGFKLYNDTFGHPAGDALLVRLADRLRDYLDGRGVAFRMGGDEFCAIFDPGSQMIEPIVDGAGLALSEHGEAFSIGCSYGSILLPREAQHAVDALRIADQRMYAQKSAGRISAGAQSRDVLLRVLVERNPELSDHLRNVAELAEAVAGRLSLSDDEVEQIRHAAELHDIGKMAIPDAVLNKPGPLDPAEWEFMRRHTLIGERIIAAAPALTTEATLVRSSHERWDGAGYPDGLAGAAIPLGARIITVADAFDAMIAERTYAESRQPTAALAELRRCAGGQFDPSVVEVFVAAWSAREEELEAIG